MPTVVFNRAFADQFAVGDTQVVLDAEHDSVRKIIRELDARFAGMGAVLRSDMAVAIDGQIYQDALLRQVDHASEVSFLPSIEAG